MSTILMVAFVLSAPPSEGADGAATAADSSSLAQTTDQQPATLRSGPELYKATRETLRRLARPSNDQADQAAREFLKLYEELGQDTKMDAVQRQHDRNKVRGRLQALSQQISKRIAIEKRLAAEKKKRPKTVAVNPGKQALGQIGPGFAGQPRAGGWPQMRGPGGVGGFGAQFGGGANRPGNADNGQQLVELIQQTIAPATWDVNGGTGTIFYWRPGRALVVRQQGEIHRDFGNVLEQLRRANR